jgi:D-alanine-D-alanine ligase
MSLSERIFSILGLRDYARIDFRVGSEYPVVLDVNTLPNLDPERSFLPIAARKAGLSYGKLIKAIITPAVKRHSFDVER